VFDPLGLPFEQFGPAGEFMTEDNFGNPLSGQSTVEIGDMAGEYANVAEFSQALSTSQTVTRCMVQKSLQHAYGRVLTTKDDPLVDDLLADFDADSRSYRTLLVAIALHPQFRLVEAQTE
jgi:hypothetical protein